jgi:hypothetical protein
MSIMLALEESQVSFIPYLPKDKQEKRRLNFFGLEGRHE